MFLCTPYNLTTKLCPVSAYLTNIPHSCCLCILPSVAMTCLYSPTTAGMAVHFKIPTQQACTHYNHHCSQYLSAHLTTTTAANTCLHILQPPLQPIPVCTSYNHHCSQYLSAHPTTIHCCSPAHFAGSLPALYAWYNSFCQWCRDCGQGRSSW
jgi:hypothetical protein